MGVVAGITYLATLSSLLGLGRVDKYPVIPVLNRNPVVLSPMMT